LNYDSTFLALLLSSIEDDKPDVRLERCIAHPLKKRHVVVRNDLVDYASDMNIILAYYKLEDNLRDDKSVLAAAAMLPLKSGINKLRDRYKEKCDIIEAQLAELSRLEKQKCNLADMAAEPFAKLMEEVMAYRPGCDGNREKILRVIGYNIGKWIYLLDAYDDIGDDIRKKAYNPFVYQYNYNGESVEEFKKTFKGRVEFNLTYCLSQISKAYELLETKFNSAIVENIIYMGMLRKTEQILYTGSCKKVEKSI